MSANSWAQTAPCLPFRSGFSGPIQWSGLELGAAISVLFSLIWPSTLHDWIAPGFALVVIATQLSMLISRSHANELGAARVGPIVVIGLAVASVAVSTLAVKDLQP